jgi:hypothetical protein
LSSRSTASWIRPSFQGLTKVLIGMTLDRRGGDDGEIAQARHGHVERARDRRGREGQDVDLAAQILELLLVAHPETVLLVDDRQSQILEFQVGLQQLVGPDQDVDRAVGQTFEHLLLLLRRAEPRQALDLDRPVGEAVGEVLEMLLGEQGGRHQHGDLPSALHGHEGRPHGDLGLAEADIAADHPIHRLGSSISASTPSMARS